jgi:hypothetical protein
MVLMRAKAVTGPTPGIAISRLQAASVPAVSSTLPCRREKPSRSFALAAYRASMSSLMSGIAWYHSKNKGASCNALV